MISAEKPQVADTGLDDIVARAPIRIGSVILLVRDLDRVARFYRDVIGLEQIVRDGHTLHLGVEGRVLISLRHDPNAAPNSPHGAGLHHIAFLLSSRNDLGAWVRHALRLGTRFTGASDHLVSEAIYLNDPEDNGIEIYADRASSTWPRIRDVIQMGSTPLELGELAMSTTRTWSGMPADGTIGHIHLRVGDVHFSDQFYGELLGFKINATVPTARFYATGGYHHQIAGNLWHSAGAGTRPEGTAGLAEFELLLSEPETVAAIAVRLTDAGRPSLVNEGRLITFDPYNIRLRMTCAPTAREPQ
jgi:catechol 2,3-dioxygenase